MRKPHHVSSKNLLVISERFFQGEVFLIRVFIAECNFLCTSRGHGGNLTAAGCLDLQGASLFLWNSTAATPGGEAMRPMAPFRLNQQLLKSVN